MRMSRRALTIAVALLAVPSIAQAATSPLLPFPNDRLTKKDKTTDTGRRLNLKLAQMPKNDKGVPIDPSDMNRADGFSPGSSIVLKAKLPKNAVAVNDLPQFKSKHAPITVTDAKSHKRWPIWAELDSNATKAKDRLLLIHPAKNFLEGHTYVVKVKGVKPFRFTVASARSLAGRMLAIRNDAFKQLGDTNLSDLQVTGSAPKFNVTKVEEFTPDQNAKIARTITGTFQVPCYLNQPGCPPGSRFNLSPTTGLPVQMPGNEASPTFICNVPRSATADHPARLSLYGHGLLGKETEINAGNVEDMANEHDIVFCATKWAGMSFDDVANAISVLKDGSNMPTIADRLQQGFLNFLYLGRLMIHKDGLPANSAFNGLVDTSHLYYDSNSQGGIDGGALTAIAPDFTRAVLGVTGMNYSVLLNRSKDWTTYAAFFNPAYTNERERPLIMDLLQLLWDRGETDGYAQHVTSQNYPNTPKHAVLMEAAVGDQQVSGFQAEVEARTIGASVRRRAADPGRLPEKTQAWGIPAIKAYPFTGSALIFWDSGPGHNGVAPIANLAPKDGEDPHEDPRATPANRDQKSAFLMPDGMVINTCGATPCHSYDYAP